MPLITGNAPRPSVLSKIALVPALALAAYAYSASEAAAVSGRVKLACASDYYA